MVKSQKTTPHLEPDRPELDEALLAEFDNYRVEPHDPDSMAHGLEQLRRAGWLGRVGGDAYRVEGQPDAVAATAASARQLRLLYDVGRASLPLGRIFEGHVNALELIYRFATGEQRERYEAEARAGHCFGVWNTEAADGLHIAPRERVSNSESDLDGERDYALRGTKTFCSGAEIVTRPIITGQRWDSERAVGWQMVVVPMDRLGPQAVDNTFWTPLGMRASASYKVDFTGLTLDESELLGDPNDYHLQPHFSGGAIRFAAVQLGGAHALYDHVLAFLRQLNRAHDPYQAHRIARMTIALQGGRNWLAAASERALAPWGEPDAVIDFANMTRTAVLEACDVVLDQCEQAVGARGFLAPGVIQRIYTDLKMYLRQPAPDNALAAVGHHAAEHHRLPGEEPS